ncbi:DUF3487 family protein [Salmonella enterica subsp. houtenae serovar [1],40:z4,z23:-]
MASTQIRSLKLAANWLPAQSLEPFRRYCGGRWLARLKRGRPESWLYRALELKLARFGIGTQRFVLHDGVWAIRRSRR